MKKPKVPLIEKTAQTQPTLTQHVAITIDCYIYETRITITKS